MNNFQRKLYLKAKSKLWRLDREDIEFLESINTDTELSKKQNHLLNKIGNKVV